MLSTVPVHRLEGGLGDLGYLLDGHILFVRMKQSERQDTRSLF